MALFEDVLVLNGWGGPVLLGLGAVVAIPVLLPIVGAVVRPVAKLAIQGGLFSSVTLSAGDCSPERSSFCVSQRGRSFVAVHPRHGDSALLSS
jgi:hypothetical protein